MICCGTRKISHKSHDFDYFSIIRLAERGRRTPSAISPSQNWPHELLATYDELGLMHNSPVFQTLRAQHHTIPLVDRRVK